MKIRNKLSLYLAYAIAQILLMSCQRENLNSILNDRTTTGEIATGKALLAGVDAPIADGVYRISVTSTGKPMDVRGSSQAEGAVIQQSQWDGGNAQKWQVIHLGDGNYKITNVGSGKVVSVEGASYADGARIVQYTWNGSLHQQWWINHVGVGRYYLVNRGSGKVINVSGDAGWDGAELIQWPASGGLNDKWYFDKLQ